ncbi:MAG: acyl-phosphate--glycerol-3-phosphate O-acyltransferase, partial [Helicobacter sp.]|nr:acyl-phosphate--glycerol-3-phosphate O-acyltransferase [Helicobacter sp.]
CKISSLASLAGLGGFLVSHYFLNPTIPEIESHAPIIIIAVVIIWKHIPNIQRILQSKEQKIV